MASITPRQVMGQGSQQSLGGGSQSATNPAQINQLANQIKQSGGGLAQLRTAGQVRADSQASTNLALQHFNNSILPQITAAAQSAGASGDALTALMAQNAGADAAGQAGANVDKAVAANETLRAQAAAQHDTQLTNMLNILSQAHTAVLGQQSQLQGTYATNATNAMNANTSANASILNASTAANASMSNAKTASAAQLAAQYSVNQVNRDNAASRNATSIANTSSTNKTNWDIANLNHVSTTGYASPYVKPRGA